MFPKYTGKIIIEGSRESFKSSTVRKKITLNTVTQGSGYNFKLDPFRELKAILEVYTVVHIEGCKERPLRDPLRTLNYTRNHRGT